MESTSIDLIYASYMETTGRKGNQRRHPSRQEFEDILRYGFAWRDAVTLLSQKGVNDAN